MITATSKRMSSINSMGFSGASVYLLQRRVRVRERDANVDGRPPMNDFRLPKRSACAVGTKHVPVPA